MEIERKFLVPEAPELEGIHPDRIEQGYLYLNETLATRGAPT